MEDFMEKDLPICIKRVTLNAEAGGSKQGESQKAIMVMWAKVMVVQTRVVKIYLKVEPTIIS